MVIHIYTYRLKVNECTHMCNLRKLHVLLADCTTHRKTKGLFMQCHWGHPTMYACNCTPTQTNLVVLTTSVICYVEHCLISQCKC